MKQIFLLLSVAAALAAAESGATAVLAQRQAVGTVELVNGRWFNGERFETRAAMYSVDGRFTRRRPARVERTIDLAGTWVVPPFGEAHNHNVSNGADLVADRAAIDRYLADGVFYVKIPGNLPPTADARATLRLDRPESIDVAFSHGSITSSGGHPIVLVNGALAAGRFRGHTQASLADLRYFTVESEAELTRKWPAIMSHRPDFIKVMLVVSEDYARLASNPLLPVPVAGRTALKGLDPQLLPRVVAMAHAAGLRVSTHINTATDFGHAVRAGVDEINHLPVRRGYALGLDSELSANDVAEAARKGITVVTTLALAATEDLPDDVRASLYARQRSTLRLLREHGVTLAIGSDNPEDTSVREALHLHALGVLDNLTLLKLWTETTPRTIFPQRRIAVLDEGYEASFLALDGDPVADFTNVRRIRVRFKQGVALP